MVCERLNSSTSCTAWYDVMKEELKEEFLVA